MKPLACACLVDQRGDELLLVRVRDNAHWYLPGGKIEPHESAESALQRELQEELGVTLVPESIRYLYTCAEYLLRARHEGPHGAAHTSGQT